MNKLKSGRTKYLLSDHLGSPHLLTGEDGQVLDELSFTAVGKRRNAQWTSNAPVGPALSTISYTGHEAPVCVRLQQPVEIC
jgi:hypothetical protein